MVNGGSTEWTRRRELSVRPRDRVVQPEDLGHSIAKPRDVAVEACETSDVDGGEVTRRLAFDDPLRERSPSATGGRDTH